MSNFLLCHSRSSKPLKQHLLSKKIDLAIKGSTIVALMRLSRQK